MRKFLFVATLLWASVVGAQNFDQYFEQRTLRLDYILAGDSAVQEVFLKDLSALPFWAGRRGRLSEELVRGNAQVRVYDRETKELIYVNTFSTLFSEWIYTAEAGRVKKAMECTCLVPMPKREVEVRLTLTGLLGEVVAEHVAEVDPRDILIRPKSDNGLERRELVRSGSMEDCIDVVFLAEGYTKREIKKFYRDCERAVDALFSHSPFKEQKARFNVTAVATVSEESGPSVPGDPLWTRTVFDSHFWTFYSERYLTSDQIFKIEDAAACVPHEVLFLMVNTPKYGGGGIFNQITTVSSDHPTFREVLVHEFGHSFAALGDEYAYGEDNMMYSPLVEPWEPNLTTLADFGSKWADLVPEGTPIPTPPADIPDFQKARTPEERQAINDASQRVGVFEGGGYQEKGVYRPAQECRMKINQIDYFCPVCTRAIINTIDYYTSK